MTADDQKTIDQLIADGMIEAVPEGYGGDLEYGVLKKSKADSVTLAFSSDSAKWMVEKETRANGNKCVYDGDLDGADCYIREELT